MKTNVEVQVLVGGKPVKQHYHEGNMFVEARHGANYEVKIKNNSWKRVLAIVSVDGLDVLSGRPATSESGGYIVDGFSSYSVKGFRVSDNEVNLFEFSAKSQSYAAKSPTGEKSTANCGIIAVRLFEEKEVEFKPLMVEWDRPVRPRPEPWPSSPYPFDEPIWRLHDPVTTCSTVHDGSPAIDSLVGDSWSTMERERGASPLRATLSLNSQSRRVSVKSPSKGFDMGTKFSDQKKTDKVVEVSFERGEQLPDVTIYYASRAALEEFGIRFEPEPKVALPSGFKDGYCRPPQ